MKLFRPSVTHPTIHPRAGLLEPDKDIWLENELADLLTEAGMGEDVTDETLGGKGYEVTDVAFNSNDVSEEEGKTADE